MWIISEMQSSLIFESKFSLWIHLQNLNGSIQVFRLLLKTDSWPTDVEKENKYWHNLCAGSCRG